MKDLTNTLCALILSLGVPWGAYKTYRFVKSELVEQTRRGLPSLEKFSREISR